MKYFASPFILYPLVLQYSSALVVPDRGLPARDEHESLGIGHAVTLAQARSLLFTETGKSIPLKAGVAVLALATAVGVTFGVMEHKDSEAFKNGH